jgi:arylsulfatase A-like enzyme
MAVAALCLFAACAEPPRQSHLLLISVDTLRADHVPWTGDGPAPMPTVESLLERGARFTHAVTPCPRTTQALASLLTGMYPHTTGVRSLLDALSPDAVPLADIARDHGYRTIAVVSNHILTRERQLDRGFDTYDFAGDVRDARQTTDAAIGHLDRIRGEGPIFLWVHYIDPHVPYYPPERLARMFDPDYQGRYALHFGDVKGGTGNRAYPEDLPKREAVFRNPLPDRVNRHIGQLYAADVRFTDEAIDALLSWVHDHLGDDWLIVFTSDHGESLGEHDYYYDHGDYVYDATLRVPLAIVPPAGRPGHGRREVSDLVSLVDVTPTIVDLLDWDLPGDLARSFEGRSLAPLLQGESDGAPPLFAESGRSYFPKMVGRRVQFDVAGRFRAVIQGRWKLIWTPGQVEPLEYELYDLSNDPGEIDDLYDASHPEVPRLVSLLRDWMAGDPGAPTERLTREQEEILRSLGYVDD